MPDAAVGVDVLRAAPGTGAEGGKAAWFLVKEMASFRSEAGKLTERTMTSLESPAV